MIAKIRISGRNWAIAPPSMGYSFFFDLRHRSANLARTYALICVFASNGGSVTHLNAHLPP
jgi:hypothetical protein